MAEHKDLTGENIHEPKGADTASAGQIYIADGNGSGVWTDPSGALHEPRGIESALAGQVYVANGSGSGVWTHNSESVHGEMVIIANATATVTPTAADATLATDSDYVKVTAGWIAGHLELVTFNADELVFPVAGDYEISFWANVDCPNNNQKVGIKYAINDATPYSNRKLITTASTSGDVENLSGIGYITGIAVADTLSIYIATTTAGDPTLIEAGLSVKLLNVS